MHGAAAEDLEGRARRGVAALAPRRRTARARARRAGAVVARAGRGRRSASTAAATRGTRSRPRSTCTSTPTVDGLARRTGHARTPRAGGRQPAEQRARGRARPGSAVRRRGGRARRLGRAPRERRRPRHDAPRSGRARSTASGSRVRRGATGGRTGTSASGSRSCASSCVGDGGDVALEPSASGGLEVVVRMRRSDDAARVPRPSVSSRPPPPPEPSRRPRRGGRSGCARPAPRA